jgi:transposase
VGPTIRDILEREQALFTFVPETGVEPTNNVAEPSLRHAVIWRNRSFVIWSAEGGAVVSRILKVVTILRQQGSHALDHVTDACAAALNDQRPDSLSPHPAPSRA